MLALLPVIAIAAEDAHVASGFDHFYNLEYDQAIADFIKREQANPTDPEIHNNIAQAFLYREMLRDGALESQLVTGNNSFLRRPKMEPGTDVRKRFDEEIDQAMSLAQGQLTKNPKDTAALYSLGVSYGLRSNYNFLVNKAWKSALSDATQARKLHNQVTELDPTNYDARLLPAIHDYIVGSLSVGYRLLGFLAGFHGDREGGLRALEEVAKKGKNNRVDAEIVLCVLYRREQKPRAALPLLDDLVKRYPRNYLLLFEKAQMYSTIGDEKKALMAIAQVKDFKSQNLPGFANVPWEKIYYEEGNIQFWYNDLDRALENLQKVTAKPSEIDLNMGVLAFMRQGQIYDLKNRHELARKAYEQAIAFAPGAEAAKESRRYISEPYRRKS